MPPADPNRVIAALARDRVSIDLKTVDLCFLAALTLRADRQALASFEEESLVDLFEQVCDVVEPGAENPRKRATHAIQRLRDQRMLARVDGAGLVHAGEYTLTRLAAAVIEYFLADESLTRESLSLLTGTLRSQLAEILAAAKKADSADDFRSGVAGPLRVTVGDLVAGIERRQRGLDAQQEEVREELARMLQADWFRAVDRCQQLLETTARTLGELNEILMRDTHHFVALLLEVQALAADAGNDDVEAATQRVIEHVDRIAAWGAARQRVWSDYYQYVHRFIQDVVRLDPGRALSQMLRDQIVGWKDRPFRLVLARAPSIRLLRPLLVGVERPPVTRPRSDRESLPAEVAAGETLGEVPDLVRAAVSEGATDLATVASRVLAAIPPELHYIATGHTTEILARLWPTHGDLERPWRTVLDRLEIENWTVSPKGGPA
ncbi:MAG: condensin subunit MukF [Planctomycetes bacterium]|nr:condensin subunit MukF [Planctomycetota bacterium]